MGAQEKEIVELYHRMQEEATSTRDSKPSLKPEVVAILTAAQVIKNAIEEHPHRLVGEMAEMAHSRRRGLGVVDIPLVPERIK